MRIEKLKLFAYKLPLRKKLLLNGNEISTREGFIIEVRTDTNLRAVSEIAPLPYFSHESFTDVIAEIKLLKSKITNTELPSEILEQFVDCSPSVRFGIESAVMSLFAQEKKISFVKYFNPHAKDTVVVNALLIGSHEEIIKKASVLYKNGYRAFKMKIGRSKIIEEISTIHAVREIVGDSSLIRLDANRAFDINSATEFYEQIKELHIDYIEEPFQTFKSVQSYLESPNNKMPIALDESLTEIQPDILNNLIALKAIVVKPTLLGFTNAMMFAKKAMALGIQPVISSSFESSIGTNLLASMAAIIDANIPIGLDTLSWFQDDLISSPLEITNGKINIVKHTEMHSKIDYAKLTEVSLDNQ